MTYRLQLGRNKTAGGFPADPDCNPCILSAAEQAGPRRILKSQENAE
jgi:hypothetical protein